MSLSRSTVLEQAPRLVILALVLGVAIWLFNSGSYGALDAELLRDRLRASGTWGVLSFLALFAFVQPLGPSGHLFVIGASMVWPPVLAFFLSLAGAALGQSTAFFFYRYVAHDWAQARIPARLVRYERAFAERPFRSVLLLRVLTFTWPLAPALLGVSRVRLAPMLLATVLGLVPAILLDVWLGEGLVRFFLPGED